VKYDLALRPILRVPRSAGVDAVTADKLRAAVRARIEDIEPDDQGILRSAAGRSANESGTEAASRSLE
jgi:hypothetical protein